MEPKSKFHDIANDLLNEMTYHRDRSLVLVPATASKLAEKMVLLHHQLGERDLPHWLATTNGHIKDIHQKSFLKGGKRLKHHDLNQMLFDEPLGEYSDYLRTHAIVSKEKSETQLTPPSQADYAIIKSKYQKLITKISDSKDVPPTYEDL